MLTLPCTFSKLWCRCQRMKTSRSVLRIEQLEATWKISNLSACYVVPLLYVNTHPHSGCNIVYSTGSKGYVFQRRVNGGRWNVDWHPWDSDWWENGLISSEAPYEQAALCIVGNVRHSELFLECLFVVKYSRISVVLYSRGEPPPLK